MFRRTKANMLEELPTDVIKWARGWDLAATSEDEKGDPAYTAGVLIGKRRNGRYIIADVINKRLSSADVREIIKQTCITDRAKHKRVFTRLPQDPGQAGKDQAQSFLKFLAGFTVKCIPESGDKVTRAEPFSAQWLGLEGMDKGNVDVLIAPGMRCISTRLRVSRKASSRIWWMRAVRRLQNLKAEIHIPHLRQMED